MTTDTTETGLETLIMRHMTGEDGLPAAAGVVRERPAAYGGTGYVAGVAREFDRAHEIDLLREYRTRLVADVVTGKLDVREAATRLPDDAAPDTAEDDADLGDDPEPADEDAVA